MSFLEQGFIEPKDMSDARLREIILMGTIRSIALQFEALRAGTFKPADPRWETRALLAKMYSEDELRGVRAWLKLNPRSPFNQTRLLAAMHTSIRLLKALKQRGVALTEAESAWLGETEQNYPLPKEERIVPPPTPPKVVPPLYPEDADEGTILRARRDASSVEGAASIGLQIFLETNEVSDLDALIMNERRATEEARSSGQDQANHALAIAYAHSGRLTEAEEAVKRISADQPIGRAKAWIELARYSKDMRYLEEMPVLLSAPPDQLASLHCRIYEVSGNMADAERAKEILLNLYPEKDWDEKCRSNLYQFLLAQYLKHGAVTEAQRLLERIVEPSIRCQALALVAIRTRHTQDSRCLIEFMRNTPIPLTPALLHTVTTAYVVCGHSDLARNLAAPLVGAAQALVFALVASEGVHGKAKSLRRAETAAKGISKSDAYTSYACYELVRALVTQKRFDDARQFAHRITTEKKFTEAWLCIYRGKRAPLP